jgi:hypothetical protein
MGAGHESSDRLSNVAHVLRKTQPPCPTCQRIECAGGLLYGFLAPIPSSDEEINCHDFSQYFTAFKLKLLFLILSYT